MNTKVIKNLIPGILLIFSACDPANMQIGDNCTSVNSISFDVFPCTEEAAIANQVSIILSGGNRIITANNIPDHPVGQFPNTANPNSISPQNGTYTITATPSLSALPTPLEDNGPKYSFGILLNGVEMDPIAAEPWIDRSDNSRNWDWNLEALYNDLGFDCNHAHVQPNGTYHYHGEPTGFLSELNISGSEMTLIGWAADGFPIYYKYGYTDPMDNTSPVKELTSSFTLRTGERPGDGISAPCGIFNGKYSADFIFDEDRGDLDECNGRTGITPQFPSGTYYYVITDEFPVIPRCFYGSPSNDFKIGPP